MFKAVREALRKGQQVTEIRRRSGANVVDGRQTDKNFVAIAGISASVQYVQSDRAWAIALKLAKWLQFPIAAHFRWENKDGAAYPEQEGVLKWAP